MGKIRLFFAILLVLSMMACLKDDVDPVVDTLYFSSGQPDILRRQAISKLYEHYSNSDKTKEYYEVVSKNSGDYILNYFPGGNLLTVCLDPGSGWGGQYKNVDESALLKMANLNIHLDSLQHYVVKDSVIDNNRPYIEVRSNGKPI